MGLFDSFFVECPECNNELEFQSKSGECCLNNYNQKNLSTKVAIGINGDIVRCQFCNSRIKFIFEAKIVKIELVNLGKRKMFNYDGNFNPKHPYSIKRQKEISKWFMEKEKNNSPHKEKRK